MARSLARQLTPDEHAEQAAVVAWAALHTGRWPWLARLYAVPNAGGFSGGFRANVTRVARLRAEGVQSGVPDLCLPAPRGGYAGLYVEMKRADGALADVSDEQRAWLAALRDDGYATAVAFGAADAIRTLTLYCQLPAVEPPRAPWPHPNTDFPPRRARRPAATRAPEGHLEPVR